MIISEFPDLTWLRAKCEERFADKRAWNGELMDSAGWPSVILHVKHNGHHLRPDIKGPLSLFVNISGHSMASVHGRRVRVEQDCFFLTNDGETYTLELQESSVETFNIHFGQDFCEKTLYALLHSDTSLLDHPADKEKPVSFYNQLYPRSGRFNAIVASLIDAQKRKAISRLFTEQCLYLLLELLLEENEVLKHKTEAIHLRKAAVRQEIAHRLRMATDYIRSYYMQDLSLDELAGVASLSKFHFLRMFSSYCGTSPHQFVSKIRIEKSIGYLQQYPALPIHQLSSWVGFADSSSFSRAFYRYTGQYPTQFAIR